MAAYINRQVSVMPGEGISLRSTCAPNGDARLAQSPLQIFVNAKKEINEIFSEIEEYVKETVSYIHGLSFKLWLIMVLL